jgi:probable F420-dependent oxidoreductase
VVDEDRDLRASTRVLDPPERGRALRLAVDGRVERVAFDREHDRDEVRSPVGIRRRQPGHPCRRYSRVVHFGVILPNFGEGSDPDGIRRVAEAAEELGFDSVWATEHVIVGPEAVNPYGRVYAPLVTLGWIAGWTERVGLGTSILLVPLHNPMLLAKEVATLQELSGGRFTLGVGMGWHRDEYEFIGVEFEGRGRRGDESLRLMRALWNGERDFEGQFWSFHNATAEPHPSPQPEIWVGGSSDRAIRRARELGDVWHPSRGSDADHVRRVKEQHPELRVVPRTSLERVDAMLEAGAEGAVVTFRDEAAMRAFAERHVGG